ncbi:hypothetical protein pipiens_006357, partial [Culex pipiens pipiens]
GRGFSEARGYGRSTSDTRGYGRGSDETRGQGSRGRDVRRSEGNEQWKNGHRPAWAPNKRKGCSNCRNDHGDQEPCPAADKRCWRCDGVGHFASTCPSSGSKGFARQTERGNSRDQRVNTLSLSDVLFDCSVGSSEPIKFMVDSGADVNIIGGADWERLRRDADCGRASIRAVKPSRTASLIAYASKEPLKVEMILEAEDTSSEETRPAAQLQPAGIDQRSCSPKLAQPGQGARPSRKKQVPSYLQDYVRLVEEELEVQKTLQVDKTVFTCGMVR